MAVDPRKAIEIEGKVMAVLAGTMFRVQLANEHVVLAHISGKMRKRFIRLTTGDRVRLQMRLMTWIRHASCIGSRRRKLSRRLRGFESPAVAARRYGTGGDRCLTAACGAKRLGAQTPRHIWRSCIGEARIGRARPRAAPASPLGSIRVIRG